MRKTATAPDDIPIAYETGGSGRPGLVFVHGWSCDRTYWANQMQTFAPRHKVVAVDLAGHGDSGSGRTSWTMAAFGADVAAVVDQEKLQDVVLIGHSLGGDVIVEAALRLRGRVRGLVWVDVYSDLSEAAEAEAEEEDPFIDRLRSDFPTEVDRFVRGMFPPDADAALVDWVAADMARAPVDAAIDAANQSTSNLGRALAGLGVLRLPVVAVNPSNSATDVASMQRAGVRTVFLERVGHFPMLEAPDRFDAVLAEVIASFA